MNKLLPLTLCVAVAGTGCSVIKDNPLYGESGVIRDRSQDYEASLPGKKLVIPAHLNTKEMPPQLVVPEIGTTATERVAGAFKVPRPEFFYADSSSENVNLAREDGEKLIVVDEAVDDVWVKVQEFWRFNGIGIENVDAQSGVMETSWIRREGPEYSLVDSWIKRLTFQDIKGDTQDKIRIELAPKSGDFGRTAIKLSHVQYPAEQQVSSIDWNKEARNISYKSDMMFEMLRYLSKATGDRDATSLLALQNDTRRGHQLGRDSRGSPVLKLDGAADLAWSDVSNAIDRTTIDVGTRDQGKGIFYVTYTTTTPFEETQEMGFFEWLHSDREEITISTEFLDTALGGGEEDENGIRYSSKSDTQLAEEVLAAELADENRKAEAEIPLQEDELANQKGFKLWLGGQVIYVFGGDQNSGTFNHDTGQYEHVGQYQLRLKRQSNGVFLQVLTPQGLTAANIVAEEILWDIKEKLRHAG